MCRKLICLSSFLFVLGLLQTSAAGAADPSLVGWWPFSEGSGTVTKDNSGNGHHGTFEGSPKWINPGWNNSGWCLQFGGDADRVTVEPFDLTGSGITLAAWVNVIAFQDDARLISKSEGSGTAEHYWAMILSGGGENNLEFRLRTDTGATSRYSAPDAEDLQTNEWTHIAVTWDASDPFMRFYKNGREIFSQSKSGNAVGTGPDVKISLGNQSASVADAAGRIRPFGGLLDDVVVFNRGLTVDEIQGIMEGLADPALASNPSPADGLTDVPRDVVLNWTPGEYAPAVNGHTVYLSESFGDVDGGIGGVTVSPSSYAPPQRLDFETTYFWRIDEVNAPPDSTVFPGEVWSFTTEPVGYSVDGATITATASSSGGADFGPEKTIDGSGLDQNDLHSTEPTSMWISDSEPLGAWIQYEFDKVCKLHQMWVWNSNQLFEGLFGFGLKEVTVEYATNGTDWTAVSGVPEFSRAPGTNDYAYNTTVDFGGAVAKYVRLTAASNWGGVLPQYGLSEVRFFSIPVSAREPSPGSGTADANPDMILSWRAGREAAQHNVYLSIDQQAVIDGTVPAVSVTDASYSPSSLDLGTIYYWRIDEVNDAEIPTTWQGDIWDFTTREFIVVENFEDYNDYPPFEVYSTWADGYENAANGSQVGNLMPPLMETTIVHGDTQSAPLFYSNTGGATYSEITRTFAPGQDWTRYGIKTLGLWFHGAAGNTGQLYVKVNGVKASYDGDAGNLAVAGWQPWNIDLTTLNTNLANVTTLAIGIDGNGAAGTLYLDDIRLYAYERQLVTPVEPDSANLVGHWPFDEGVGTTAVDSSGNGHNGTLLGQSSWSSPGWDGTGSAVNFIGTSEDHPTNGRIAVDPFDVHGTGITMAAWIRPLDHFNNDGRIISKTLTGSTSDAWWSMLLGGSSGEDNLQCRIRTDVGVATAYTAANTYDVELDEWTHAAALWDSSDQTVRLYKNGEQILSATHTGSAMATDPALGIGIGNRSPTLAPPGNYQRTFHGLIDDVRIYDRGLSQDEIRWLAGRRQPYDKPF